MPRAKTRYCSGCKRTHDYGRPCRACFKHRCSKCKAWNEIDASSCWSCGAVLAISAKLLRETTHPDRMNRCPIEGCGTMLRLKPRDGRRAAGKKRRKKPVA
jgi:hypothetical protein